MNLENRLILDGLTKLAASKDDKQDKEQEQEREHERRPSPRRKSRFYNPQSSSLAGDMTRDAITTSAMAIPALTGFTAGHRAYRNYANNKPLDTGVKSSAKSALIAAALGAPAVGAAHGLFRHLLGN
jgi:hypothetical protein